MKYALASQRKIRLADAWSVNNKLSTIDTIDKLMMAEALQECLSRFPKKKIRYGAKTSIRRAHLSGYVRDVIAQFKCSKPLFTVKERFSSKTVVLLKNLKQKVAWTGRLLNCLFYKVKTKVITNRCTTGRRAIEQRLFYIESQERKKKQQKKNRCPMNDLE